MRASEASPESRVREIASRIAETTGLELVLAEFRRAGSCLLVALTIDREGGVTLEDCADFSRRIGAALDAEDPISGSYRLEVSSPGLDRRLVRAADYERFRGRTARVSLAAPLAGRRNFVGVLRGMEGGEVVIEIEGGNLVRFPISSVDKARLVPEF